MRANRFMGIVQKLILQRNHSFPKMVKITHSALFARPFLFRSFDCLLLSKTKLNVFMSFQAGNCLQKGFGPPVVAVNELNVGSEMIHFHRGEVSTWLFVFLKKGTVVTTTDQQTGV